MKILIQRVTQAAVHIDGSNFSKIKRGLLTLMGIEDQDTKESIKKAIDKISQLRVFEDCDGKMNLSLQDLKLENLIVSQFTLAADCRKGRRPSFQTAAHPEKAKELYEFALEYSKQIGVPTQSGRFQANMQVELTNDGPVTFFLEF